MFLLFFISPLAIFSSLMSYLLEMPLFSIAILIISNTIFRKIILIFLKWNLVETDHEHFPPVVSNGLSIHMLCLLLFLTANI